MKIEFRNCKQALEANKIIRCKFNGVGVFHISYDESRQVIDVYTPTDRITCYQIDDVNIEELKNG